jgi:hypothetical protein
MQSADVGFIIMQKTTSNPLTASVFVIFAEIFYDELLIKFACVGLSLPGRADRTRAADDAHRSSTKHQGVFYMYINKYTETIAVSSTWEKQNYPPKLYDGVLLCATLLFTSK